MNVGGSTNLRDGFSPWKARVHEDLSFDKEKVRQPVRRFPPCKFQPFPGRYGSKKPQSLTSPLQEQYLRVWMPVHCATSHPRQYYLF